MPKCGTVMAKSVIYVKLTNIPISQIATETLARYRWLLNRDNTKVVESFKNKILTFVIALGLQCAPEKPLFEGPVGP